MTSQSVERGEGLIELKATALAPTHVADGDQDGIAKVLKRERLGPKAIKSLEQVTGQKVSHGLCRGLRSRRVSAR